MRSGLVNANAMACEDQAMAIVDPTAPKGATALSMPKTKGKADGGMVNRIVKAKLG